MPIQQKCFLTGLPAQVNDASGGVDAYIVNSPACGLYWVSRTLAASSDIWKQHADRLHILAAVARQRSDAGEHLELHTGNIEDLLATVNVPDTPIEKIDLILQHIRSNTSHPGETYHFDRTKDFPIAFARNIGEWDFLFAEALKAEFIEGARHSGNALLTLKGWERIEHLAAKAQTDGTSSQIKEAMNNDYNLTPSQKAILRLLVEHVRTDGREGDDVWITFTSNRTIIEDFEGEPQAFSRNVLDIFARNGLMSYHNLPHAPDQYICTLTQKAKEAVASDYGAAKQGQRTAGQQVQVFFCYASEDTEQVMDVHRRFEAEGFEPWIDKEALLPGQDWDKEIRRAIKQSDRALAFFSTRSVSKKGYYQRELKLLLEVVEEMPEGQDFVIPVRLDECEIPDRFKKYQYANLFETDGFEKIVKAIKAVDTGQSQEGISKPLAESISDLKQTDTLILKYSWENVLEKNKNYLYPDEVFEKVQQHDLSREEFEQSLEILRDRGFIKGEAIHILYRITPGGYANYARVYIPEFEKQLFHVIQGAVNHAPIHTSELAKVIDLPEPIVTLITELLEANGHFQTQATADGGYGIVSVSAELRRKVRESEQNP